MSLLIQNGQVFDPKTGRNEISDVFINDNQIQEIGIGLQHEADEIIDATGCYVMPGFIDLHVHLRDPGLEYKETLKTGGMAAARGGVTTICAMPNTKPVIDSKEKVEDVHNRAKQDSPVHVIQLGAITVGQAGTKLADIKGMAEGGCHAISEDGKSVMDVELYRQSMELAAEHGIAIFAHCEDADMVKGGVMNADKRAKELGLPGISNEVEDSIVARDIELAAETGVKLHLCHCSTADSVRLVKEAKSAQLPITAEVCPHHFIMTTDDITKDNGRFKMNPPLRTKEDVEMLRFGLKYNIMDVIATDHAPHAEEEKNCSIKEAAFGIVGLETMASLTHTELVKTGDLTPMQMAEKMSYNPAKVLGLDHKGSISEGMHADIVIFDPEKEYEIDVSTFFSKGKNTPFDGRKVIGDIRYTIVDGKIVYQQL